jgi:hypothetical protein
MKAVIETAAFLASAREVGLSDDFREFIVQTISDDPMMGALIPRTGGCRKSRFPGRGKGKSGGYRTVHYNGPDDVPILLLVVFDKGDKENLSQDERNELRKLVQTYAAEYRAGMAAKVAKTGRGSAA